MRLNSLAVSRILYSPEDLLDILTYLEKWRVLIESRNNCSLDEIKGLIFLHVVSKNKGVVGSTYFYNYILKVAVNISRVKTNELVFEDIDEAIPFSIDRETDFNFESITQSNDYGDFVSSLFLDCPEDAISILEKVLIENTKEVFTSIFKNSEASKFMSRLRVALTNPQFKLAMCLDFYLENRDEFLRMQEVLKSGSTSIFSSLHIHRALKGINIVNNEVRGILVGWHIYIVSLSASLKQYEDFLYRFNLFYTLNNVEYFLSPKGSLELGCIKDTVKECLMDDIINQSHGYYIGCIGDNMFFGTKSKICGTIDYNYFGCKGNLGLSYYDRRV